MQFTRCRRKALGHGDPVDQWTCFRVTHSAHPPATMVSFYHEIPILGSELKERFCFLLEFSSFQVVLLWSKPFLRDWKHHPFQTPASRNVLEISPSRIFRSIPKQASTWPKALDSPCRSPHVSVMVVQPLSPTIVLWYILAPMTGVHQHHLQPGVSCEVYPMTVTSKWLCHWSNPISARGSNAMLTFW